MTRMLGAALLSVATAACGGGAGGKAGASTTPNGGSGSTTVSDDPTLAGTTPGSAATPGSGSGSTGPNVVNGTPDMAAGDAPPPPPIVMPNMDPDPAAAKSQVDDHLRIAKNALAQSPPDPDGALREAKAALAIDATNIDAAAYVAFAYYHKHLYDTAELVLDDVFKRDAGKSNANVAYVYGLVYDKTNRPEQAVLAFKQAVQLNPQLASAQVDLGLHLLKNKSYAEAQTLFEGLHRGDAVSLTLLGSAYRGHAADYPAGSGDRNQLIQRAQATYQHAIAADRNYGPAYYDLGLLFLDSDPFPAGGGNMDTLQRLNQAKQYFDNYKDMPGVDMKLYDQRMKDISKATKREEKRRKKGGKS